MRLFVKPLLLQKHNANKIMRDFIKLCLKFFILIIPNSYMDVQKTTAVMDSINPHIITTFPFDQDIQ